MIIIMCDATHTHSHGVQYYSSLAVISDRDRCGVQFTSIARSEQKRINIHVYMFYLILYVGSKTFHSCDHRHKSVNFCFLFFLFLLLLDVSA